MKNMRYQPFRCALPRASWGTGAHTFGDCCTWKVSPDRCKVQGYSKGLTARSSRRAPLHVFSLVASSADHETLLP